MATRLDNFLPIDPGAPAAWSRQPEQQHAAKGGKKKTDDDDDDEEDDDDDDDDEEDDDDDFSKLDEDELRERLADTQTRLSKASGSSASKRKRIATLRKERDEARAELAKRPATAKKPAPKGGKPEETDVEAAKAAAREEGITEAKKEANERIVKAEARGALKAAGIPKDQVGRLVGMLKLADIDVDDDGAVDDDALDEAIEELKKDWPQLFPKGGRKPRERVAGGGDKGGKSDKAAGASKYSATELQVAAALGKRLPGMPRK